MRGRSAGRRLDRRANADARAIRHRLGRCGRANDLGRVPGRPARYGRSRSPAPGSSWPPPRGRERRAHAGALETSPAKAARRRSDRRPALLLLASASSRSTSRRRAAERVLLYVGACRLLAGSARVPLAGGALRAARRRDRARHEAGPRTAPSFAPAAEATRAGGSTARATRSAGRQARARGAVLTGSASPRWPTRGSPPRAPRSRSDVVVQRLCRRPRLRRVRS